MKNISVPTRLDCWSIVELFFPMAELLGEALEIPLLKLHLERLAADQQLLPLSTVEDDEEIDPLLKAVRKGWESL
ncbi:hypothetical protein EMCRGX_G027946 [Ephydatia muelleri]